MRIFAVSDVHVDYDINVQWIKSLSLADYSNDLLILAGDVTDATALLGWCIEELTRRFKAVLFVPGNHDLWVIRERHPKTSLQKFTEVMATAESAGGTTKAYVHDGISVIPLFGWYDYSFGMPNGELKSLWMDFHACRWPAGYEVSDAAAFFGALNEPIAPFCASKVITFSHFLPRLDVMPVRADSENRLLAPVLGTTLLENQLRRLGADIHVYGHSHRNRKVTIDGVTYINNALGYPREISTISRQLLCIHDAEEKSSGRSDDIFK